MCCWVFSIFDFWRSAPVSAGFLGLGLEIGRYRRMANDWDLFAIVRSCSNTDKDPMRDGDDEVEESFFDLDGFIASGNWEDDVRSDPFDELQHVYLPFYGKAQLAGDPISAAVAVDSGGGGSENKRHLAEYQSLQEKKELLQQQFKWGKAEDNGAGSRRKIPYQSPGRRRKSRPRLIVRVNAKTLSRDSWSWRKYGQKPIKGSPHPRNYYRCSTSKSCSARKQVELSQDNPEEYIVSYIGDHTHARPTTRRSGAGTTRNPQPPCSAAPAAVTDLSPTTPLISHYDNKTQNADKENKNENSESILFEDKEEDLVEEEEEEEEEEEGYVLIPNTQMSEETLMAIHVLNSRASPPTIAEPHSPAKNSVDAAGSSD